MKLLKRLDTVAATIVLTGAAAVAIKGLAQDRDESQPRSAMTGGYAVLGAAIVYSTIRLLGPKSRRDRHLSRMTDWYDQADGYQQRVRAYSQAAEEALKRLSALRGKDR